MSLLYLDHNATTPLDPGVLDAMMPWLGARFGNPSSLHAAGQAARRALDRARAGVARLIGAQPDEIVFTSGGTEADNLAILGAAEASAGAQVRIVTSAVEHPAVLQPCAQIARTGGRIVLLPVDAVGRVDLDAAAAALRPGATLASVMLANNDVGTLQPVAAIAAIARERGAVVHTDAIQAAGRIPVDVAALGVDLLSLSSHKLYGPQGVGALFVRRGTALAPRAHGGRQERGLRPGTENVAAIVGFGRACELAAASLEEDAARLRALRDAFEAQVRARIPGVVVHGGGAERLPNTSFLGFEGIDGDVLVVRLDLLGLAASTGAACSSAAREPSHVLLAMGCSHWDSLGPVRFSFGRGQGPADATEAIERVVQAVGSMRAGAA